MAQCKQTAHEFIQNTFSPAVAVLCSPDAELLCHKNNLSFVELVQPFCRLTTEGIFFCLRFLRNRLSMHSLGGEPMFTIEKGECMVTLKSGRTPPHRSRNRKGVIPFLETSSFMALFFVICFAA